MSGPPQNPDEKDDSAGDSGSEVEVEVDSESAVEAQASEELELFREPEADEGDEPAVAVPGLLSSTPPPEARPSEAPSPEAPPSERPSAQPPLAWPHPPIPADAPASTPSTPAPASTPSTPAQALHEARAGIDPFPARPLRLLVVTGARGGVGKTVLAANLGLYLATIGRKVVLVDADASGANLHTCLGTSSPVPAGKLRRQARNSEAPKSSLPFADAAQESPFKGLRLLHLGLDEPGAGGRNERLGKWMSALRELDAEYVVVDLGVGLTREILDAYLGADLALFVTVPEPTAMENSYRFLRGAFARQLLASIAEEEPRGELERRLRALGGAPSPLDLLLELEQEGHPLAERVREAIEAFRPHVVINQTRLRADLDLGFAMQSATRRRLGITLDYVGHVDHDDTVWTCVRNRRPLLLEVPGAKSSRKIEKIARHLLMVDSAKGGPLRLSGVPTLGHHDLLEIERGASDEDIRRAYKRCRDVYSHDSLCCYGLFEPHEIEKLRARLDEAFDVLVDPSRRRPYELSVFPAGPLPKPAEPEAVKPESLRPPPDISPDTQFTGAILRQVRESQRVTLTEVNQRTKISPAYLKAIEEDDFGRLPELVYTSGFLRELARCFKLDPQQVSRSYAARYKRYLEDRERGFARKVR